MSTEKVLPTYQDTPCGFRMFPGCPMDAFESALQYKPLEDDLFIVTYPKCGTTWVQNIVACIFRGGKPFTSAAEFLTDTPFLEMTGEETVRKMVRPGAIKTHLPFEFVPWSPLAKYILVTRNPKDCCVSFYHHMRNMPMYKFSEGEFDVFFELFMEGQVDFGDYFDFLLPWWEHREDPNVLFLTYEDLKRDTRGNVLRIAEFIHPKYKEALLSEGGSMLEDVVRHTSFSFMKDRLNKQMSELAAMPPDLILNHPDLPDGVKKMLTGEAKIFSADPNSVSYCRKGEVGDWKTHLSPEQNRRLEEKFRERTKGTDIPKLWEGII